MIAEMIEHRSVSFAVPPMASSAYWGPINLDQSFYPPIIGNYWQLLAIIAIYFLQNLLLLVAIIAPGPKTLIIAIIRKLLLQ